MKPSRERWNGVIRNEVCRSESVCHLNVLLQTTIDMYTAGIIRILIHKDSMITRKQIFLKQNVKRRFDSKKTQVQNKVLKQHVETCCHDDVFESFIFWLYLGVPGEFIFSSTIYQLSVEENSCCIYQKIQVKRLLDCCSGNLNRHYTSNVMLKTPFCKSLGPRLGVLWKLSGRTDNSHPYSPMECT